MSIAWQDVVNLDAALAAVAPNLQTVILGRVEKLSAAYYGGADDPRYKLARILLAAQFGSVRDPSIGAHGFGSVSDPSAGGAFVTSRKKSESGIGVDDGAAFMFDGDSEDTGFPDIDGSGGGELISAME